jgi:hypothetical protein
MQMGYDRVALSTALQALVTCCHFVIDAILTSVSRCSYYTMVTRIYCRCIHAKVYSWLRSRSPETHSIQLTGGVLKLEAEHARKSEEVALIAANKARY